MKTIARLAVCIFLPFALSTHKALAQGVLVHPTHGLETFEPHVATQQVPVSTEIVGYTSLWEDMVISFSHEVLNNQVLFSWATLFEVSNDFFTLEKSVDGIFWETVGTVPGAGFSSLPKHYALSDASPYVGLSYYRLTQTDFDGEERIVGEQALQFNRDFTADIMVFPNPTLERITVVAEQLELSQIQIYNGCGQALIEKIPVLAASEGQIEFDLSLLPPGAYSIQVGTIVRKIHKF